MSSYEASAYTDEQVTGAMRGAGFRGGVKATVAKLTTEGLTLTQIAEKLQLNPQRFWAYYQVWCRTHAEPLRLGSPDGEAKK